MYPTLYHALLDLTGLDLPFLKFLNSFGFFVAVAFLLASWTLSMELRRKQALGLLKPSTRKVTVGAPASLMDLVSTGALGFLLGWKGVFLLLDPNAALADTQGFLLSGKGSFFGGLAVGAFLTWLRWREKEKQKLDTPRVEEVRIMPSEHAGNITLTAALWGLIGAKIFHWLENPDEFMDMVQNPSGAGFFSGLTMYGGLICAGAMVIRYFVRHGMPALEGADAAAPGVMLAYAVGRIGCQVSGDGDWGIVNLRPAPSWMPDWLWSYSYPNNVNGVGIDILEGTCFPGYCRVLPEPVFPTPLYETIACLLLFGVLWGLRKRLRPAGSIFFLFLMLNGIERFLIEKIRVNEKLIGNITQAEVIAALLILAGVAGLTWIRRKPNSHPPSPAT